MTTPGSGKPDPAKLDRIVADARRAGDSARRATASGR